ncbi:UDP-glycosyltransferase 92A1 [Morella rubra]|nr:UDP-glycosyltransferase 92A1 [Morella rubra]
MAQGHIIPFLALARYLEQRTNYTITFVNTPLNIKKLRSSLPPNSSISLVEIPFCNSDHGLPSNNENTNALPYHLVIRLLEASTSLKPAFKKLIENLIEEQHGQPPLCIIADIFFGWTASLAKELNVFHAIFSGAGGYGLACYYSLWVNLPHRKVDSDLFSLPDFPEASSIHITQLPTNIREADGTDSWSVFQKQNLSGWMNSDGILFNTVEELDHTGLLYFSRTLGRPAWPIGPVLLSMESRVLAGKGGIGRELCIEWLSTKPLNSVLYVSFGSMNTISASQMMQLAMGLESSGRNFVWVVRPPIGFEVNSEFKTKEWLPEGFEERIKDSGRGLLVHNWAPQLEILTHKSVSAFLTHCGWNSVLEALNHGVPMIGWPMAAEQFFNVKLLEEKLGVCVEVARGKSCEVRHEDIAAKIELVMGETSGRGKDMRRQARQLMEIIRNAMKEEDGFKGSSVEAMEDFFSTAMTRREKTEMEKKIAA